MPGIAGHFCTLLFFSNSRAIMLPCIAIYSYAHAPALVRARTILVARQNDTNCECLISSVDQACLGEAAKKRRNSNTSMHPYHFLYRNTDSLPVQDQDVALRCISRIQYMFDT